MELLDAACPRVDVGRHVGGGAAGRSFEYHPAATVRGPGHPRHGSLSPGRVGDAPPTAVYLHRMAARDLVHGHVGRPLLKDGGKAPVSLKKGHVPQRGVEARQALQRRVHVPHAAHGARNAENNSPLGRGAPRTHGVPGQKLELIVGHGPRREHVPGVPPQRDWRGEGKFVWNAPYGLGPHVGGATGCTGPGGAVAAGAGTGSPYQGPA